MKPDYPFWVPDYDRSGRYAQQYPLVSKIFRYPGAHWYGEGAGLRRIRKLHKRVNRLMQRAHPALPIIVIYSLPDRDMGMYSRGGSLNRRRYYDFVEEIAIGIGEREPVVIFEPDGLAMVPNMLSDQAAERLDIMRGGLVLLDSLCNATVYVDVGHSAWLEAEVAGKMLTDIAVPSCIRGFSVNVSNYRTTAESIRWAEQVAEHTCYKHYVIDTSRNGSGPMGAEWCNPPGRSLGVPATQDTASDLCDAYLWIKVPGESDGQCNGGPAAGQFWPEYADQLVRKTTWLS